MASEDRNVVSVATPADNALTPVSTITVPEKVALSHATTAYDPANDKTPRTSKDSGANQLNPFETDIEAMEMVDTRPTNNRMCAHRSKSEQQVWPTKEHWKQKAKSAKVKRSCNTPLARLSHRNRIIAKVLIVFLIVGIAVGVGFGVSKPLGAPIWGDNNND
jgi:hypothetical protein